VEENKSAFEVFELNISNNILGFLKETSSWTYFLSILGFVGIGLMVLIGIFLSVVMSDISPGLNPYAQLGLNPGYFGLVYVILAGLYFFPVLYLFNFSRKMKNALSSKNNEAFESAFSNLKSHYKFVGIMAIVLISMYIIIFLIAALGAPLF